MNKIFKYSGLFLVAMSFSACAKPVKYDLKTELNNFAKPHGLMIRQLEQVDPQAPLPAIAMQSENVLPKRHVFQQLESRFKSIELLYDNDFDKNPNWGRIFADKFAKEFGLVDSFIPDKYQSKDFSDLVKNYGQERAQHILLYETLIPF